MLEKEVYKQRVEKVAKWGIEYRKRLGDIYLVKQKASYYKNRENRKLSAKEYYHRVKEKAGFKEGRRTYANLNSEANSIRQKRWAKDNPDKVRANRRRRKTFKLSLPNLWSALSEFTITKACILTSQTIDIHADHFIPLAWGHGGTYLGNMIPMTGSLNISKGDANPYKWFHTNKHRLKLEDGRFTEVVSYLAELNGLTPSDFRQYVDWCYANQRSINEIKRDNERYGYVVSSIELWREATEIPFPSRINFGNDTLAAAI
jgi:hypothetical protein